MGKLLGIANQGDNKLPLGVIDMHPPRMLPVVAPVGHIHIPLRIHGHAGGQMQLPPAAAGTAELGQPLAFGGELLYPMIAVVGHIDAAGRIHGQTPRGIELAFASAELPPAGQELPLFAELADLVTAAVADIEAVGGVNRQAGRAVRLAVLGFQGTPTGEEVARGVIDGNEVQPLVGNIDAALAIGNDARGPDELAAAVAVLGELADKLLLAPLGAHGQLGHPGSVAGAVPGNIADALAAAIGDIDQVVRPQGGGHRLAEAHPGLRPPADRVAVIVSASGCYLRKHSVFSVAFRIFTPHWGRANWDTRIGIPEGSG